MNTRRIFETLFLLIFAGCLAWFVMFRVEVAQPTIDRVIFVTIDTLRADHLGIDGYKRESAPFIDGLAKDGIYFKNAYSAIPHTAPSHASIFTSLFPFQHGLVRNHESLSPQFFNLYLLTQLAGFRSKAFPAVQFLDGKVGFPSSDKDADAPQISKRYWYRNAEDVVNWAVKWLDQQSVDSKDFLWLHFYDVHQWQGRGRLPKSYIERIEGLNDGASMIDFLKDHHKTPVEFFGGTEQTLNAINGYDARLAFVDSQLQRLSQYLRDRKMDGNTLWVITADHGEGLGNHNYEGHGMLLYEEQLRVPLIFYFSGQEYGSRKVDKLVRLVDLLPTFAEIFKTDITPEAPGIQGISLLPLIEHGEWGDYEVKYSYAERRPKDEISFRRTWEDGDIYSLHSNNWKFIEHSTTANELYDRQSDPFELKDVIQGNESVASELKGALENIRAKGGAKPIESKENLSPEELEELKSLGYM